MPCKILNLMLVWITLICKIKNVQWKQHYNFAHLQGDQRFNRIGANSTNQIIIFEVFLHTNWGFLMSQNCSFFSPNLCLWKCAEMEWLIIGNWSWREACVGCFLNIFCMLDSTTTLLMDFLGLSWICAEKIEPYSKETTYFLFISAACPLKFVEELIN